MRYYSTPITEKEKISNALLSFDETEFDRLMQSIHKEWYDKGYDNAKAMMNTPLPWDKF